MPAELISSLHSPIVALVHHPLCLEAGLAKARQDELYALGEGRPGARPARHRHQPDDGAHAHGRFRRAGERITVAEPGTDPATRARGTGQPLHAARGRLDRAAQGL